MRAMTPANSTTRVAGMIPAITCRTRVGGSVMRIRRRSDRAQRVPLSRLETAGPMKHGGSVGGFARAVASSPAARRGLGCCTRRTPQQALTSTVSRQLSANSPYIVNRPTVSGIMSMGTPVITFGDGLKSQRRQPLTGRRPTVSG
jgi:hypothetical protein